MPEQQLIGRSVETGALRSLAGAVAVLGDVGIGKSALLADLAAYALAGGARVLSAAGREQERGLVFAGLRQLLRSFLIDVLALDGREGEHLRAALGMDTPGMAAAYADVFCAGAGLARLLATSAGPGLGLLVLADDAQWLDTASLEALAFAARCLDGQVPIVVSARGSVPPFGFDRGVPILEVQPLAVPDARTLLEAQPSPPRGHARTQVLALAGGNPLALIELAHAISADPSGRRWAGLPLPLTDRLRAAFAPDLASLPAQTRESLLLMAAATDSDLDALGGAVPGLDPELLAPAEEVGLITVDREGPRFRHDLGRCAAYRDAPFAGRAAAHRRLAHALHGYPARSAWHLGAASLHPDEGVAALLSATAPEAQRRNGRTAAGLALELSGDLSPDPGRKARRLAAAAQIAARTGQTAWAQDLATRALGSARDQDVQLLSRLVIGWALTRSGRHASAGEALLSLAGETARDDPAVAWKALALASEAAYQAGTPGRTSEVAQLAARLPSPGIADAESRSSQAWVAAVTGLGAWAGSSLARPDSARTTCQSLSVAGAAAWLADETAVAIALLEASQTECPDPGPTAEYGGSLAPLSWAYFDVGRWGDALAQAAAAAACPETDICPASRQLVAATVEAARGNGKRTRDLTAAAMAVDAEHSRVITARAWHALGLSALSEGDYPLALGYLRRLFADDGSPYHPHVSYLAVADIAVAAARAGKRLEGRDILERLGSVMAASAPDHSPRLRQQLARARGILADPSTATAYPDDVLSDPAGSQWPFERARLQLEYGEWLRRQRRINDAKRVLSEAADTLRDLGAAPWARRADCELRACGVPVPACRPGLAALGELTPQQQQIVQLAAQGLTNREISERLYISVRTVSSHLYRSYPKLGVAARYQLHGILTPTGG